MIGNSSHPSALFLLDFLDCLSEKGSEENYYQVKKAVPVTVLAFSVFATLLSPISFLTLVGNAYTGRSYLWFA